MENLISVPDALKNAAGVGRLVFPAWSSVSQSALIGAWRDAGLDARLAPGEASELAVLKSALGSVSSMRRLIRPLPNRQGYGIVAEHADGERSLTHVFLFAVWIERDAISGGRKIVCDPPEHPLAATVRAAWAEADGYPRERLSSWFSQTIIPALHGIAVRPMGGVWWVPPPGVATLDAIDVTIRSVGAGKVYSTPAVTDAGSLVESILDGIAAETEAAAKAADAIIEKGDTITSRGIRGEIGRLGTFAGKLDAWASALDVPLTTMREKVIEVQATLVLAEGVAEAREEAEREAKKAAKKAAP